MLNIDSPSVCFVIYRYTATGYKTTVNSINDRRKRKTYKRYDRMAVTKLKVNPVIYSVCIFEKDDPEDHTVIAGVVGDKWYGMTPAIRKTFKSQMSAFLFIQTYYLENLKPIDDVTEVDYDYNNCFKESRAVVISKKDYMEYQESHRIDTPKILVNGKRFNRTRHWQYFIESLECHKVADYKRGIVVYW